MSLSFRLGKSPSALRAFFVAEELFALHAATHPGSRLEKPPPLAAEPLGEEDEESDAGP